MGHVGTLQSQLASLVEEEEGLLRQQLDGELLRALGLCLRQSVVAVGMSWGRGPSSVQ